MCTHATYNLQHFASALTFAFSDIVAKLREQVANLSVSGGLSANLYNLSFGWLPPTDKLATSCATSCVTCSQMAPPDTDKLYKCCANAAQMLVLLDNLWKFETPRKLM